MKQSKALALAATFILLISSSVVAVAQETKTEDQKMMEAYMKYAMPDENHEFLKKFAGTWDVESKMWIKPGTEPSVSNLTSEGKMILGGRYLYFVFTGTMMGQPFKGIQIVGYDKFEKKYRTFWIDNTSTPFFLTSGNLDESGKVLTEKGTWPDFMTGGTSKVKAVTKVVSDDKIIYEMYMIGPDGKEFKSMENTSTRKK
jgi:hypothetical protein